MFAQRTWAENDGRSPSTAFPESITASCPILASGDSGANAFTVAVLRML